MKRLLFFIFGVVSYALFFVTFLYTMGFLTELFVPRTIYNGPETVLPLAVLINVGILALFAVQHSVMARPGFKKAWTKIIPAELERPVYVLLSSLIFILLFWQWRPMPNQIWDLTGNAALSNGLTALCLAGFVLALYSSFLINHFDLFGLRQVYLYLRGVEYFHVPLAQPALYRWVRNPLMLGWLIAFWSTPNMTWGRWLFCVVCTAYIFIGTKLEERDLIGHLGETYEAYRDSTPMIIPRPPRG